MLYPQLLGPDFDQLPRALRDFHSVPGGGSASGTVTVRRFRGWLAGLVGFPAAGERIPLELRVVAREGVEVWIRSFRGVELRTVQRRDGNLLLETAGPVRIRFRLAVGQREMRFRIESASFWFVPIPLRIEAREWGDDTSWDFEVVVSGIGSYRGRMVPAL